jgi:FtsP/CotA-like multicopper oxidase with cupredoxin domain
VLVQILADANQPDWTTTFAQIFNSGKIPEKWLDMPADYRDKQMEMIRKYDDAQKELARRNNLLEPERLSVDNQRRIDAGEWPQYLMGAFPNFFDIPDYSSGKYKAGQAPGTHWYHAHKHGSTSLHILNGLAGALIIESNQEGGYDHFIRKSMGWTSYGDHEKIFVFQQYDSSQNLMRSNSAGPRPVLVNGKLTPIITMRPGEIQLWRLINATEGNAAGIISAGNSATGLFQTQGFTFRQTAQDGVQFNKDNYLNQPFLNPSAPGGQVPGGITLAAGNRVDLLVQAPTTAGRHEFTNKSGDLLFIVRVTGTPMPPDTPPMPTTWTEDLVGFLKDLPAPSPNENPNFVQFQWEAGRKRGNRDPSTGFPPHFMINGKQFGEYGEVVDQCMPQDGLQDWILENYTVIAHPFHIHINPFQVIQIDTPVKNADPTKYPTYNTYAPTKSFVWQDVIAIPPAVLSQDGKTIAPGRVRIRHKFLDFTGTFVLHCHILAHEDRGMMQLVRVVRADNYPNGCQLNIPAHH